MKIAEAVQKFLTFLEGAGRSPQTISSYQDRLKVFTNWLSTYQKGTVKDLDDISMEMMDDYATWLYSHSERYSNHPMRPAEAGGYSKASIAAFIQAVKRWLTWCYDRKYMQINPGAQLEKPKWSQRPTPELVMTRRDLYAMIDQATRQAMEHDNLRDLAVILFAADTGARRGEIAKLRVSRLNLEHCTALVDGKTGERTVDYTEKTAEVLSMWLAVRDHIVGRWGGGHDFVFCGINSNHMASFGKPLSSESIYRLFARLAEAAGVKGTFNPHSLRHLLGQSWTDQGVNLELLRQKLGHSDVSVTARFYAHQDLSRVQAATKLASLLNGYRGDIDIDQGN